TADSGSADDSAATGPIRIGAKAFTEQYILMSLLEQSMAARGLASKRVESLGSNIVFDALSNGDIDVYIDYSGTLWANAMKRTQVPARWRVLAEMDSWLAREHGIRNLGALGFENAYALVMRRDRAAELGITTIGDLARVAPELAMGADFEFYSRPEWTKLRDTYGLSLRDRKSYDPTLMYPAVVEGEVDVITAFSSDGRIAAYDLVILEDPREALPPYDAVLLLAPAVADRRDLVAALTPLVGTISVATMQQANLMVDRKDGKKSPTEAARWLLGQISGPSEPPTQ
ncbi:MAG: glycine betaine ABC transporter substrate-binding protein, partial [Myxococcota bacterium]